MSVQAYFSFFFINVIVKLLLSIANDSSSLVDILLTGLAPVFMIPLLGPAILFIMLTRIGARYKLFLDFGSNLVPDMTFFLVF